MATAAKTYTFTPSTVAYSGEVNQNFDDLVDFLNTQVIHRDASRTFTQIPSGPASSATTDNQFTRKKYVDDRKQLLNSTTFSVNGLVVANAVEVAMVTTPSIPSVVGHAYQVFVKVPRVFWTAPGGAFSSFLSIDMKQGAGAYTRFHQRAEPASFVLEYSYDTDHYGIATATTMQFRANIFQNSGGTLTMNDPGSVTPRIYVIDLGMA